jgi:hypothetical protein
MKKTLGTPTYPVSLRLLEDERRRMMKLQERKITVKEIFLCGLISIERGDFHVDKQKK